MRRARRANLLAIGLVAIATRVVAADAAAPDDALRAVEGTWTGTLTYRDYRRPDRLVTLPTMLTIALAAPDALTLHYVFDDGPSKIVHGYERVTIDPVARRVVWSSGDPEPREYAIVATTGDAALREYTIERPEGDHRARLRLVLSAARFEIAKDEVGATGEALFRNRFAFTRPAR